ANVLYATQCRAEASERYRQAVEVDPSHAEAWNNLGVVLGDLKRHDDAADAFRQAIALDYSDAHYNFADLLESGGPSEEATKHWQAYLRYDATGEWSDYARNRLG